jgi:uncharacterized protein
MVGQVSPRVFRTNPGGLWDDDGVAKVDEHAQVPRPDPAALERLAAALDRDGVVAASLFGSHAAGRPGPLSDVDVAVWLDPDLDDEAKSQKRLELTQVAAEALGHGEVDVVVLNGATPLLRHRAVRDGRRLVERDARARVRFETRAILDYLDTARLRQTLADAQRRRLKEGTFGRR